MGNNNGLFVKKEEQEKNSRAHKTYKQFSYVEDVKQEGNDYQFDTMQDGQQGTRVPITSQYGGVEGGGAYGKVVQGSVITAGPNGEGFVPIKPLIPSFAQEEEEPVPEHEKVAGQSNHADAIRQLMQAQPQQAVQQPIPQQVPYHHTQPQLTAPPVDFSQTLPAPEPEPIVEAKLSGPFGSFKGKYTHIIVKEDLLVLVYPEDASVFSPPANGESFKISCQQGDYSVYFVGIEFDLPFIGKSVQVMIRNTD